MKYTKADMILETVFKVVTRIKIFFTKQVYYIFISNGSSGQRFYKPFTRPQRLLNGTAFNVSEFYIYLVGEKSKSNQLKVKTADARFLYSNDGQ